MTLVGQKFDRWTIIGKTSGYPNRPSRRRWLCKCDCGTEKIVNEHNLLKGSSRSCGCRNTERVLGKVGPESLNWRGGCHVDSYGYVNVYLPDHPRSRSNGYIRQHLLVMEQKLGRGLLENEEVHHLNGQKADNRPENLELWVVSQPSGQRASDLLQWAKDILTTYKNIKYE